MNKLQDKNCSYGKLVNWLEKEHNVLFSTFNIMNGLISLDELKNNATLIFKKSFENLPTGVVGINEACYLLKNNLYIYYYDHSTYILYKAEQSDEMMFFYNQLKKKSNIKNGNNG